MGTDLTSLFSELAAALRVAVGADQDGHGAISPDEILLRRSLLPFWPYRASWARWAIVGTAPRPGHLSLTRALLVPRLNRQGEVLAREPLPREQCRSGLLWRLHRLRFIELVMHLTQAVVA